MAHFLLCIMMLLLPVDGFSAENFFVTKNLALSKRSGGAAYSVKVDFPLQGNGKAMGEVKKWICEHLCEYDSMPEHPQSLDEDGFRQLLEDCCELYLENNGDGCKETMEIYRSYEDEEVVTYEMQFRSYDKPDGDAWRDEDCVSVSKADGHRIQANEIFRCSEDKIKELMWEWRGDLPVEDMSPKDLIVGNVAFIDGWILVTGPANGYTGAIYKIRYQAAEPFLVHPKRGDYYDGM